MPSTTFGDLVKKAKESGAFADLIPDGDFTLEIVRANGSTNKQGVPRLGVLIKVVGADPDDEPLADDDDALGASTWLNLSFSEKAAPISFRQLKSFGVPEDFLENAESIEDVAETLAGIVVAASVGHRSWGDNNDRTDNTINVNHVKVPPAIAHVPVESDDAF